MKFGKKESKKCSHVFFPTFHIENHVGLLYLKLGKYDVEPFKVYCYKPLQRSIEQLIKRKGLIDKCERWRSRKVPDGYLCDI